MGDLAHDADSGGLGVESRLTVQVTYAEHGVRERVSGQRDNVSRGPGRENTQRPLSSKCSAWLERGAGH